MSFDFSAAVAATHLTTPKTAVLVGGTTGMGAATALTLARAGVSRILIVGRDDGRGVTVMSACREYAEHAQGQQGLSARFIAADLS